MITLIFFIYNKSVEKICVDSVCMMMPYVSSHISLHDIDLTYLDPSL